MALKKPAKAKETNETETNETETNETETNEVKVEETQPTTAPATLEPRDPKPETSAVVATKPTSTNMATSGGSFESEMASEGFEGLEEGFHSYVTVKLAVEGNFQNSEAEDLGKSLKVNLLGSKAKYSYTTSHDDDVVEFSYDQQTNAKGEDLNPILDEWIAEGGEVSTKKYLDVMAEVVEGDLDGEVVMLSVSPSGVQKFTGYMRKVMRKGLNPEQIVTEIYVGNKVTTVKKPFYPWAFRLSAE